MGGGAIIGQRPLAWEVMGGPANQLAGLTRFVVAACPDCGQEYPGRCGGVRAVGKRRGHGRGLAPHPASGGPSIDHEVIS